MPKHKESSRPSRRANYLQYQAMNRAHANAMRKLQRHIRLRSIVLKADDSRLEANPSGFYCPDTCAVEALKRLQSLGVKNKHRRAA